jgi:hypothetical protein
MDIWFRNERGTGRDDKPLRSNAFLRSFNDAISIAETVIVRNGNEHIKISKLAIVIHIKLLSLGDDMENYENPSLYDTKHWSVTGMVFTTVLHEI